MRGGLPLLHVIDEGIFRGFIPINHHWVNDDPGTYYDISNSVRQPSRSKPVSKTAFSAFDLDGYQVVRSQFLQLRYEGPVINISNERISFNKFCVQKFDRIAYIQLLLHPAERRIAIRPCRKADAHSIRWRPDPEKPVYSKTLNCQHFGNALYSIMKPGKYFTYGGERVDLTADQYLTYNTTRGQEAYTALTALVSSTAYRNSSDEDKAALVGSVYSLATEIGKSRALGGEYQSKTLDKFLDVNRAGVSLADYVTVKASLDLNGNGSISQTEASEVLDGSGLSSQQKAAMWKSINSGWKTNPYE